MVAEAGSDLDSAISPRRTRMSPSTNELPPTTDITLLTRRDVAVLLGLSPSTVERLERRGQLRSRRTLSGGRYFLREDVEHLRHEHEAEAEEAPAARTLSTE